MFLIIIKCNYSTLFHRWCIFRQYLVMQVNCVCFWAVNVMMDSIQLKSIEMLSSKYYNIWYKRADDNGQRCIQSESEGLCDVFGSSFLLKREMLLKAGFFISNSVPRTSGSSNKLASISRWEREPATAWRFAELFKVTAFKTH